MTGTFSMMTEEEFADWQKYQPITFELKNGIPILLPEKDQTISRINRIENITNYVFKNESAAQKWLNEPNIRFSLLSPKEFSSKSESNCQEVMRLLIGDWHMQVRMRTYYQPFDFGL